MYLHGDSAFGYSPGIGTYLNDDNYRPRWVRSGDNVVVYSVFSVGIAPTTENNILLTGFPKPYTHTWINVFKMGSDEMHEVYLNLDGKITSNNIPIGAYKINFCYRAASLI